MNTVYLSLLLLSFSYISSSCARTSVLLSEDCSHSENEFKCVDYVRNYDADTITVNIPGLHPLIGKKISIRVSGIDTPEIRTKDLCEKEKGKIAKRWVEYLLKKSKRIDLLNISRGKYFRVVADVYIDGINLTEELLDKGMGYPYLGGTKKKINWCLPLKKLALQFKDEIEDAKRNMASE